MFKPLCADKHEVLGNTSKGAFSSVAKEVDVCTAKTSSRRTMLNLPCKGEKTFFFGFSRDIWVKNKLSWTLHSSDSSDVLRVGRCFLFQHGSHVSNRFTAKECTKVCFWHFRWEIGNAETESSGIFDQHCPVWQFDPRFVIRCPGQAAFGWSWSLVMQICTLAVLYCMMRHGFPALAGFAVRAALDIFKANLGIMLDTLRVPVSGECFWSDEKEWFWAERQKVINRSISL